MAWWTSLAEAVGAVSRLRWERIRERETAEGFGSSLFESGSESGNEG